MNNNITIELECKNCKRIFTFGTSNADNNCTFCDSKCEEDYSFIDYHIEEDMGNEDDDNLYDNDPVDPSIYQLTGNMIYLSNCFIHGEIVERGFAHLSEEKAIKFINKQNAKIEDNHKEYLKNKYGKKEIPKWDIEPKRGWSICKYQILWC